MSKTSSLHYDLCCAGARWLRDRKNVEHCEGRWKYVAVELCVQACENPDIWAFNGWSTIVVEVKVSRADFLNDKKKVWHQQGLEECLAGNYRYYLTPKGLLTEADLPDGVGLLEWDGKAISRSVRARRRTVSNHADGIIMASLLRRENFPEGIYNYRGCPTTIKSKKITLKDAMEMPETNPFKL